MVDIRAAIIERGRGGARLYKKNARSFFSFASTLTLFSVLLGLRWVFLIYTLYYVFMCKKISLYYQPTKHNRAIVSKLKGLEKVFYPHILWILPQIQTVVYFVRQKRLNAHTEVEIEQDDGGSFFINVYNPAKGGDKPGPTHTVVLVHGLGGSGQSKHVTLLGAHLLEQNFRVIAFNARGTLHKLKTPTFFHIGWTKDLVAAFRYVMETYEGTVSGVGFSLGGHWLTKVFGELHSHFTAPEQKRILGGMAISIPFDFVKISEYMKKPIPKRIYNRQFARKIHKFVIRNRDVFEREGYPVPEILKTNTLHGLDTLLTAPVFKIKNIDDYYFQESAARVIPQIDKPFLILNSKDDPIVPLHTIPIDTCTQSSHVILALTEKGGHMGFLGYNDYLTYAEEAAIEFIQALNG
ncbi:abhydrolase domain-containing protein 1/3 [Nematocida displodere]|uniref:Abhydrolase domain-containing protein 1/3 n=1 Tax=Nematocida displodere TaxID=1805483 RepID=A0A177EC61_9MICR|nr:abhydrolase domain-containing protein 1/3 [Nematocida displodere]